MKPITDAVCDFLEKYPPSLELYRALHQAGDLYLIGGVLREYRDKGDIEELRDIDIIINVTSQGAWQEHPQAGGFRLFLRKRRRCPCRRPIPAHQGNQTKIPQPPLFPVWPQHGLPGRALLR